MCDGATLDKSAMPIVRTRTLGVFVVAALVLLVALAVALLDSRSQARSELEQNFAARARIAAAVIESTLKAAAQTQGAQDRAALSSPRITAAQLQRVMGLAPGRQTTIVTDARGVVMAAVPAGE